MNKIFEWIFQLATNLQRLQMLWKIPRLIGLLKIYQLFGHQRVEERQNLSQLYFTAAALSIPVRRIGQSWAGIDFNRFSIWKFRKRGEKEAY